MLHWHTLMHMHTHMLHWHTLICTHIHVAVTYTNARTHIHTTNTSEKENVKWPHSSVSTLTLDTDWPWFQALAAMPFLLQWIMGSHCEGFLPCRWLKGVIWVQELNLRPLKEQLVPLTTEPSVFQVSCNDFYNYITGKIRMFQRTQIVMLFN